MEASARRESRRAGVAGAWHALLGLVLLGLAAGAQGQTYSVIKSFGILTNVSGFYPQSTLAQGADGTLYGTALSGEALLGGAAIGTVFKINPDGTGFAVLKWFTNSLDGAQPYGGVVVSGNTLYGTAASPGTVFKLNVDGTGFTVLKRFNQTDGANPYGTLVLSNSTLYGTTQYGGSNNLGTVFKLGVDGSGYAVLKHFLGSDGANPYAGVVLSGGALYGTTSSGGPYSHGTVFRLNVDGSGYTVLKHFGLTYADGYDPRAGLVVSGNTLYGSASGGGNNGLGTVFKVNSDGSGFTVLKLFDAFSGSGSSPSGDLALSGSALYGTTSSGGTNGGGGTVFKMDLDGTGFTVLKHFMRVRGESEGPRAGLVLSGNTLYGTTAYGGSAGLGTVFKVNVDGTASTVLKHFTYSDGATPRGGMALSGSTLYGTSQDRGSNGAGTVFKVNLDGSGYKVLKDFAFNDGYYPQSSVALSGGALYGTTLYGGSNGIGTVYRMNVDGSGYAVLKHFTGSDGREPRAGLALGCGTPNDTLYGTTERGGSNNYGTVFKLNADGTGFSVLKHFTYSNGAYPYAPLLLSGSTLYGTTSTGGSNNAGTVFKVNADGTGFAVLKYFAYYTDGGAPYAGLVLAGNTLYGTASAGGSIGYGTVFKLNVDGTGFTVLKPLTSADGGSPNAGLVLSGSTLYGTGVGNFGAVFKLNADGTGFTVFKRFSYGNDTYFPDGANPYGGLVLSGGRLFGTAAKGGLGTDSSGVVFALTVDENPIPFNGSVALGIEPPESVAAGAQWRVNGGAWLNSGQTATNIPAGSRLVEFKPVPGWRSPVPFEVRVVGGLGVTNVGRYLPVAVLTVGGVPTQRIYQGTPAEFRLQSAQLGAGTILSMSVSTPLPAGVVSFNPATGLFSYTPAASDRLPFSVTFTATRGTNVISQVVSFQPIPGLPPERAVFGLSPTHPLPGGESRDYLVVNTTLGAAPESFNHVERTTRSVTISGKTLVLQAGHANGLFNSYNENDDLKTMDIHAETLIVRGALRLPQTTVSLHARELRFEGSDARIDTTPRTLDTRPAQFVPGVHGLKGGDITVHAETFFSEPQGYNRFVMNGGNGQPGGLGQDGVMGVSKPVAGNWKSGYWPGNAAGCTWPDNTTALFSRTTYYVVTPLFPFLNVVGTIDEYWPDGNTYEEIDSQTWRPGDGSNALPGGRPGNGGQGGVFTASLNVADYSQSLGGCGGAGIVNVRGEAGLPRPAYRAKATADSIDGSFGSASWSIHTTHTSQPGQHATSAPPSIIIGAGGTAVPGGHALSWLSPYALRMVLAHAKDAYLYGHLDTTDTILAEYEALLVGGQSTAEWAQVDENWRFEFSEMLLEIQNLRHRLAAHLDYFGNPAGWVPMLSFEANKAAYETEIDRAIRVLYLSYWIGNSATTVQATLDALDNAKVHTVAEIEQLRGQYSAAIARIPVLQAEAAAIEVEVQNRLAELHALEQALLLRAGPKLALKRTLGVAAAICKVVPVYQPVLAAIGTGLDAVVQYDPEHPYDTAIALGGAIGSINEDTLAQSAQNWRTNANIVDLQVVRASGLETFKAYVRNMGELVKPMGSNLVELGKIFQGTEMPRNEIDAELAKIKAEAPEFQNIADKIKELVARKEQYVRELNLNLQAVTSLAAGITHDLLSLDAMNRSLADGSRVLDPRAVAYLKEMDRRARERLLKYHYYMAKAYEYRLLQPYPGELNLTLLFDRMAAIAGAAANQNLTAADFNSLKAIYEEQLSSIASGILADYNNNRPELSAPIRFNLSASQLAQLNAGQSLTLNLHKMGLFPPSEENVRIVNWRIYNTNVQAHVVGGGIGAFAFMDLYMEHSGLSTLASGGEFYLFRHYNNNTQQPFVWGARYDALNHLVDPIEPSTASESLIRSLLGPAGTSENLLLFSRPSAWADIVLTKQVHTDNGTDIVIDSLQLELQYDFALKSTDQKGLEVTASGGFMPYFTISSPDLNSRQDALGEFARTYSRNSSVTITAPQTYGEWRFSKWTDQFGNNLPGGPATNAVLTTLLSDHKTLQAQYAYTHTNDLDADTMDDTWEVQYFGSASNASLATDHDGDGVSDAQEFWSGTNPLLADTDGDGVTDGQEFIAGTSGTNASSRLLISLAPNGAGAGNVRLSWETVSNRFYRVYAGPSLFDTWTNVYGVWGDGTRRSYTNQMPGLGGRFFRVGVELPTGP